MRGIQLLYPDRLPSPKSKREWHAVLSGDFLELVTRPARYGKVREGKSSGLKQEESKESVAARSRVRAQNAVRRLVNANRLTNMWTLTFAIDALEGEDFVLVSIDDQKDREVVLRIWKAFVRKWTRECRRKEVEFKYVAVLERHGAKSRDERKRDTFHIHFATNLFYGKRKIQAYWNHGIVHVDDFTRPRKTYRDEHGRVSSRDAAVRNPGAYMSKYISKDFKRGDVAHRENKKSYFGSRNLTKPIKISMNGSLDWLLSKDVQKVYESTSVFEVDGEAMVIYRKTLQCSQLQEDYVRAFRDQKPSGSEIKERIEHERALIDRNVSTTREHLPPEDGSGVLKYWYRYTQIAEIQRKFLRVGGLHNFQGKLIRTQT